MRPDRTAGVARWMPPSLLAAVLLHNIEEAATYGLYRPRSQLLIQRLINPSYIAPSTTVFFAMLALVSVVAGLAMLVAWRDPSSRAATVLVVGLSLIMLTNVVIPHVPAAILLGGYAPGALTAVLVNMPLCVRVLCGIVTR